MKLPIDLRRLSDSENLLQLRDSDGRLRLDDSPLSAFLAQQLRPDYRCPPGLGWLHYDGRVWCEVSDDELTTEVQKQLTALFVDEAPHVDGDRRKRLAGLLSANRIRAVKGLLRGLLREDANRFDSRDNAHLLNCHNGVVDLRTGELLPHDPDLLFTKITAVGYRPGFTHPEWDTALQALPPEVRDWLQVRLGQALTGVPPSDDVLMVWHGGGENGKSTLLAFRFALGTYSGDISERVLTARPGDHPTEMTDLKGLRCAVLEELPPGPLSENRLKKVIGADKITARKIRENTMSWDPTHTPVIVTNHPPRVAESDHGTWRRLLLVTFPYRYLKPGEPKHLKNEILGTPGLRERVRDNTDKQHEAALAWVVAGAIRLYNDTNHQHLPSVPDQVRDDTEAWRHGTDLLALFADDELVFDPAWAVLSLTLFGEFAKWLTTHGHAEWSDVVFAERLQTHRLAQRHRVTRHRGRPKRLSFPRWDKNPKTPKGPAWQWLGVRFRTPGDEGSEP
jgi:putative DNA primase/helicase